MSFVVSLQLLLCLMYQKYPFFSQLLTHDQSDDYSNSISVVLFWQGGFAINFLLLFHSVSLSSSIYFRPLMTSSVKTCLCRHEQQLLKARVFVVVQIFSSFPYIVVYAMQLLHFSHILMVSRKAIQTSGPLGEILPVFHVKAGHCSY